MRSLLLRVLLLSSALSAGYAGSTYTPFEPEVREARAQELAPTPDPATLTATATQAPTPVPTEVAPSPTATSDIGPPAPTATATTGAPPPTATTTATATAASPVATETPVPTPVLPPLLGQRDESDSRVEANMSLAGGVLATGDGRAALSFPQGAVPANATVSIVTRAPYDLTMPALPERRLIGVWQLDAVGADGQTPITAFPAPVTAVIRATEADIATLNPHTLKLWRLNEIDRTWQEVATKLEGLTLTASLSHFSTYGLSGDPDYNTASFTDSSTVDLNGGSTQLSIPIEVPVGPGGLAPNLSLNYDSGRVNSMQSTAALGSWAGIGWHLSTGAISGDLLAASGTIWRPLAISSAGAAGGVEQDFSVSNGWRIVEQPFTRINLVGGDKYYCNDHPCTWEVTTQDGTKYYFGEAASNAARLNGAKYYQWDLSRIVDVSGNTVTFTYNQIYAAVSDGFPSSITWNSTPGDQYSVEFDIGDLWTEYVDRGVPGWPRVRQDVPWCATASVQELRRLKSVRVKVDGVLLKQYDLAHTTTNAPDCATAGLMKLDSVTEKGRNGGILRTMNFTYGYTGTVAYPTYPSSPGFLRPYLTNWTNGLGGAVTFAYQGAWGTPPWNGSYCGLVNIVQSKTVSFGSGQPDVVTQYTYYDGPDAQTYSQSAGCTFYQYSLGYLGYRRVHETTTNVTTEHYFWGSRNDATNADEARAGREKETIVRNATDGTIWHRSVNTWGFVCPLGCPYNNEHWGTRFIFLDRTDEYLRDNARIGNDFTYDFAPGTFYNPAIHFGTLIEQRYEGDPTVTTDDTYTATPHVINTTAWIMRPQYERVTDRPPSDPAAVELRRTNFYYDGASAYTTVPAAGRLTASSTLLNATETATTYTEYNVRGQVYKQSAPTSGAVQGGPSLGFIPAGVSFTRSEYHAAYPALAVDLFNEVNHQTHLDYDLTLQKPTKVTEPTDRWMEVRYDEFGRQTKVWDQLASETYPARSFSYDSWDGTAPSKVQINAATAHGFPAVPVRAVCFDGFGRTVDELAPFNGPQLQRVQRIYSNRGLEHKRSNPMDHGTSSTACPSSLINWPLIDRTEYGHDPFGNVSTTQKKKGGSLESVMTTADYNGLTTTARDANGHRTREVRNLGLNTRTVYEDTGTGATEIPYVEYADTVYTYDRMGQLTKARDDLLNETTMVYDLGGRKISMDDPDMDAWTYTYDVAGNLKTQKDHLNGGFYGVTTTLNYDALQRVSSKTYSNGDAPVTYEYDTYPDATLCANAGSPANSGKGRITRMSDGAGQALYCYDVRGREIKARRIITGDGAGTYDISQTFNAMDKLEDLTYPDGEIVHHTYNLSDGRLTQVCQLGCLAGGTYLNGSALAPHGGPSTLTLGTATPMVTSYAYDFRLRPTSIATGTVQSLTFGYDKASNVTCVGFFHDCQSTGTEKTAFAYDDLDRLTSLTINNGASPDATYAYSTIGNLTAKTESATGMLNNSSLTLAYPVSGSTSVGPHAVSAVSGTMTRSFYYDLNGNQIGGGPAAHGFDAENRFTGTVETLPTTNGAPGLRCIDLNGNGVITLSDAQILGNRAGASRTSAGPPVYDFTFDLDLSGAINLSNDVQRNVDAVGLTCPSIVTRYVYDGNGALLKRTTGSANMAVTSWTVYVGGIYEKTNTGAVTKYYEAYGRRIAMRDAAGVHFLLGDHLGSTSMVLSGAGAVEAEQRYWPYGAARMTTGVVATDKQFTGQQQEPGDAALGLYNYKARFYSTVLGRFVSVDPLVGSAGDPQSWNAYTYVRNNPLRYTDPSGMDPVCLIVCTGSPDQVVVEDGKCHACVGKSDEQIEEIRLGMIGGAWKKAQDDARTNWVIGVVAYQNAMAAQAQSGAGGGCGRNLICQAQRPIDAVKDSVSGCARGDFGDCLSVPQQADLIPITESCLVLGVGALGCAVAEVVVNKVATLSAGVQIILSDCSPGAKILATGLLVLNDAVGNEPLLTEPAEGYLYHQQNRVMNQC